MKRVVVISLGIVLFISLMISLSATAQEPACNGLCKALSRLEPDDPAYVELYTQCSENGCLKYCATVDDPGCEGLCNALGQVDPESNAHDVIYFLACKDDRSCACCKPPQNVHKTLMAVTQKYEREYVNCFNHKYPNIYCYRAMGYLIELNQYSQLQYEWMEYKFGPIPPR